MSRRVCVVRAARLDPRFPLARTELKELVECLLDALGLENASLEITLVDDREIARLNEEFMGCVGPTNVLSFPAEEAEEAGAKYIGELALSVDAVSRESHLYAQPPVLYLARLLAHGILHLVGHDHGEIMHDLTDAAVDRVALAYPVSDGVLDVRS